MLEMQDRQGSGRVLHVQVREAVVLLQDMPARATSRVGNIQSDSQACHKPGLGGQQQRQAKGYDEGLQRDVEGH